VQELERVAFGAIAPPCHVYPDLGLYRKTGLPFFKKLMTDPRDSRPMFKKRKTRYLKH
jgi:hypothetical protein